jgi:hypothetical protein
MFEAADRSAWDHTASLLATVVGLVDKRSTLERYHPYRRKKQGVRLTAGVLGGLKKRFKSAQS